MLNIGEVSLEILHTPGHTPGGISIFSDGALFTGDLILPKDVMAMEMEEADEELREKSIRELISPLAVNGGITIHPGHGDSFHFNGA